MLYYMLQPSNDDEEDQEITTAELPDKVNKIMRNSLSMEQNEVLNLAAQLAAGFNNEGGENKAASGAQDSESAKVR